MSAGIREHPDGVVDEVTHLLSEPITWFLTYPNWPSGFNSLGRTPLEISIAIAKNNNYFVRYGVDVTDHRCGIEGNWNRYLKYAKHIIDVDSDHISQLWNLLALHMDGIPTTVRTPMLHGVAYGPSGFKRAALYFNTCWLSYSEFEERFPNFISVIDRTLNTNGMFCPPFIEWVSYDFVDTEIARTKFYWRISPNNQTKQLSEIAGHSPDLDPARKMFEHFRPLSTSRQFEPLLGLQLSFDPHAELCHQKLYFSCPEWGWNQPKGLLDLIIYLSDTFSLDLWPLYTMLGVFSDYKIQLNPTFCSIAAGELHPSVTFYFYPILEKMPWIPKEKTWQARSFSQKTHTEFQNNAKEIESCITFIDRICEHAIEYVLRARTEDGYWTDFALPQGISDEWVTAYITTMLSKNSALFNRMMPSVEWLKDRFRTGEGWGYNKNADTDADSTALSLIALHRIGRTLPEGACDALLRFHLPNSDMDPKQGNNPAEIMSVVLLAQLETNLVEADVICNATTSLLSQQRKDGGWSAFWWKDDLLATYRAVEALNAFVRCATSITLGDHLLLNLAKPAVDAVRNALPFISARTIPNEPFVLGLWLNSWFAANGTLSHPSIGRILYHLHSLQQNDGRWLSVPMRRAAMTSLLSPFISDSDILYLDPQCLITTTTVIAGLKVLQKALKAI